MHFILANVIQDAFGPLITVFEGVMVFIHNHITGGSWGLAIIGLTVVVRLILVPLTLRQARSMIKLQALAPEMKALQERYKEDKQRLNEEMMKLYRERGVNPFASCLPLLLQLPVFFSLFYMLRLDLKKHICLPQMKVAAAHAHVHLTDSFIQAHSCNSVAPHSAKFLFIPDLTAKSTGWVLGVLIVLYIGSQLLASLLMTVTSDRNQRLIALGLPFVFTIFIINFPAGLLVYWITTNIWTVGQQYVVKKRVGTPPPVTAGKAAPAGARALRGPGNGAAEEAAAVGKAGGNGKATAADGTAPARTTPPPRPPRKRKKRSGRRR